MRSVAGVQTSALGVSADQRIITNNFYAHDERGDNPSLYKLLPLLSADTSDWC